MVLDAQPLEDEAGYGRLIELEGGGTFLKKSFPRPSKDFWACRIPVCMDGEKRRAVEKQIHEAESRKASGVDRPFRFL